MFRILSYIALTQPLGRAYKVTDELFDLSTMAMEYFKENIEPSLPEITYFGSDSPSEQMAIPLWFLRLYAEHKMKKNELVK